MQVTINGDMRTLDGAISVAELLDLLKIDTRKIAVERNLAIVPKSLYASTALAEGDQLEIVNFVGGG